MSPSWVGGAAGSLGTTKVQMRSPRRVSGMPMVAELANPGAPMRSSSISRAEMFSPPRMMTSFLRPLMRMRPSSSM